MATALLFAAKAHEGQSRKDGRTPYIVHPVAVMRVLSSELGVTDPDLLCVALLHDVLEDTPRTSPQLRLLFGDRVTRWIEELTIPEKFHGPTVPDSDKTELLVGAVSHMSWEAVLVKLADRTDNLRDSANATWSAAKKRSYRGQSRAILRAVSRRSGASPSALSLRVPLRRARRLLQEVLSNAESGV
ncbi:MAG: HD domain-containing protein [Thermoplasmata archaeon]